MRPRVPVVCLVGGLFLFACVSLSLAADPLRIYIVTDLEGASGVYRFAQTREPGNPLGEKAKEYLMGDIAAVVRGLRAGGAKEIIVSDGHGSQAFLPRLLEPGARARLQSTSGGSSETELNELAVKPTSSPVGARALTMVTPVANMPSASRNSLAEKLGGRARAGRCRELFTKTGRRAFWRGRAIMVRCPQSRRRGAF